MHVCLRFVVRVYQAQLVILMYEGDSQSQFTLYSSVSVLNKLISLGLNLTRVTRPYQVVTVTNYIEIRYYLHILNKINTAYLLNKTRETKLQLVVWEFPTFWFPFTSQNQFHKHYSSQEFPSSDYFRKTFQNRFLFSSSQFFFVKLIILCIVNMH